MDKQGAPEFWARGFDGMEDALRKTAQVVNKLQQGQCNNCRRVDLGEGDTTEVILVFAELGNVAMISPQDANSAAELAAGTLWAEVEKGKVIIHHAPASIGRRIGLLLVG